MDQRDNLIHRDTFRVRHAEADRHGGLKLAAWFDFLQETAANHANRLGFGLHQIGDTGRLWVLSRLRLRIGGAPAIGETLTVETYPNGLDRLFAKRQFRVFDGAGTEVACASSWWLMLHRSNLRPVKPSEMAELHGLNPMLPDYFPTGPKQPLRELPTAFTLPVRFSMEDVNGHMNNAQYAGLVQDFLALESEGRPPAVAELEIQFHSAVRMPETLAVSGERTADGTFFVQGRNAAGGGVFTAAGATRPQK